MRIPLSLVVLASLLLQLAVSIPSTASAGTIGLPPEVSSWFARLLDLDISLPSWPARLVTALTGTRSLTADPAGMLTHDISLSTPWTVFQADVNGVGGNLVQQVTDLTILSIGFAITIARTYNSATANRPGPFGHGRFWTYGMQVIPVTGGAMLEREDGRADIFALALYFAHARCMAAVTNCHTGFDEFVPAVPAGHKIWAHVRNASLAGGRQGRQYPGPQRGGTPGRFDSSHSGSKGTNHGHGSEERGDA